MDHPTLEKLAKERAKLLDTVSVLSDEQLDRKASEGWTIRELLTHLLNAEEDHCRVVAVSLRGQTDRLPTAFSLNEHNQQRLAQRGVLSREELLSALAHQRERTEGLFNSLSEEQLAQVVPHPALGEMEAGKIFRVIGIHEKSHLQEISALLADGIVSQ